MYDLPEARPHTDELWAAIAEAAKRHGLEPPPELTRSGCLGCSRSADEEEDLDLEKLATAGPGPSPGFQDGALFLTQTCGLPLSSLYRDSLKVVAVPIYSAPVPLFQNIYH